MKKHNPNGIVPELRAEIKDLKAENKQLEQGYAKCLADYSKLQLRIQEAQKILNELPKSARGLKYPPEFSDWLERLRVALSQTVPDEVKKLKVGKLPSGVLDEARKQRVPTKNRDDEKHG